MSAPHKKGLRYFTIDCIQEDNLNYVEAKHGVIGFGIVVKLWQKIYKHEGYFTDWDEKNLYLFAREIGEDAKLIKAVVDSCLEEGMFDEGMLKKYKILTGRGIQKRYLNVCNNARRKGDYFRNNYCLLMNNEGIITEKSELITALTPKTHALMPQSRLDNSECSNSDHIPASLTDSNIQKTKRVGASENPEAPARVKKPRKVFVKPARQECRDYFLQLRGDQSSPRALPREKCEFEADKFFDHYEANGWVQGKGKPLVDWKAAMKNWIRRNIEGQFTGNAPAKVIQHPSAAQPASSAKLPPLEKELNFLYEHFLEGAEGIMNISTDHYNHLKSAGRISFDSGEAMLIRSRAKDYIEKEQFAETEKNITRYMKLFGVVEYFRQQRLLKTKILFHVEHKNQNEA